MFQVKQNLIVIQFSITEMLPEMFKKKLYKCLYILYQNYYVLLVCRGKIFNYLTIRFVMFQPQKYIT